MPKNPVEEFLETKQKTAAANAKRDLDLWQQWNEGGRTPEGLQPLMQAYAPLINRRMRDWKAPAVSPTAFKAELRKHFITAAESFDPNRGTAFNTHLQTRLQKAKRFNKRYQNVAYMSEEQSDLVGPLQVAQESLQEDLGRAPTLSELSSHMGLPEKKLKAVQDALRKDVPASAFESDPLAFSSGREGDVIRLFQRRPEDYLTNEEADVFKHIYGVGGSAKITATKDLAARLGKSQPKISRLKTSIADKIKKHI